MTTPPLPAHAHVWAKRPENGTGAYPLAAHLLDTALVAGALWDTWLRPGLRDLLTTALAPGDPGRARQLVQLAAGLHDLGKANPVFALQAANDHHLPWREPLQARLLAAGLDPASQSLARQATNRGTLLRRHEYVGAVALTGQARLGGRTSPLAGQWLPAVVTGHHGTWRNPLPEEQVEDACRHITAGGWGSTQDDLTRLVCTELGLPATTALDAARQTDPLTGTPGPALILLTGLVILADWLASDDTVVDTGTALLHTVTPWEPGEWTRARATELTRRVTTVLGTPPEATTRSILHNRPPRPLQQEAITIGDQRGLWVVAAPTGEGKTEAALIRHHGTPSEGLLFALPTRATTNAIHARLGAVYPDEPVILSHGFAAIHDNARRTTLCGHGHDGAWFSTAIRRLFAPTAALTCDQILTGALPQSHTALRLLALANHHIVLDEVHTFDAYQTTLLTGLLTWWGATDTRVTLLSATLPAAQHTTFADAYTTGQNTRPQHTSTHEPGDQDPHAARVDVATYPAHRLLTDTTDTITPMAPSQPQPAITWEPANVEDPTTSHATWAHTLRNQTPAAHIGIVANTVDRAIAITTQLLGTDPNPNVLCLHSRMTANHRRTQEETLLRRLGPDAAPADIGLTVVGTQIIEASLDIDFDYLATELAPAPSLIQRAGRLWRFRDPAARHARIGVAPIQRTLRVTTTLTELDHEERDASPDGSPQAVDVRAARPYFDTELTRVWNHIATHPTTRVPDDIQAFVDSTHFTLATAQTEDNLDETVHALKLLSAANTSRTTLTTATSRPRLRFEDLEALTHRDDAEDAMRTRYIDHESVTYLLLDTRTDPSPHATTRTLASVAAATGRDAIALMGHTVPVSEWAARRLADAAAATLTAAGLTSWNPTSRTLATVRPLDLAHATDVADYDPHTGLVFHPTTSPR